MAIGVPTSPSWAKYQSRPTGPSNINLGIRTVQPSQNGYGDRTGTAPATQQDQLSGYAHEAPHNTLSVAGATPFQVDQHMNAGRPGLPGQGVKPLPVDPQFRPDQFRQQAMQADPAHQSFLAKSAQFSGQPQPRVGIPAQALAQPNRVANPDLTGISLSQAGHAPGLSAAGVPPSNQQTFTGVAPSPRKIGVPQSPRPGLGAEGGVMQPQMDPEYHSMYRSNAGLFGRHFGRDFVKATTDQQYGESQRQRKLDAANLSVKIAEAEHLRRQTQGIPSVDDMMKMTLMPQLGTAEATMAAMSGLKPGSPAAAPTPVAGAPASAPAGPPAAMPPITNPAAFFQQNNAALGSLVHPESGNTAATALQKARASGFAGLDDPMSPHARNFAASLASLPGGLNPLPPEPAGLANSNPLIRGLSKLMGYGSAGAADSQAAAIQYHNKITGGASPEFAPAAPGWFATGHGLYDPMAGVPGAQRTILDYNLMSPDAPTSFSDPNAGRSGNALRQAAPRGKAHPLF